MKALNVLLAILVSLAVGLLVFEGGLRLMGKGPEVTHLDFHPTLGWAKKPNFEVNRSGREFDITIRTNQFGLVDDEMESRRKPGAYRVLTLGDSFTQGYSVDRTDLFVDRLEAWWQAEGRDVDVLNAGTEAYDTAQAVAWYLEEGRDFEADLVLLFAYQNDLYWNSQVSYPGARGDRDKPRFSPTGELETGTFTRPDDGGMLANSAIGNLFRIGRSGSTTDHSFTGPNGPAHKEVAPLLLEEPDCMADIRAHTRGALLALQRQCEELGAAALVVPIPSRDDDDFRRSITAQLGGAPASTWSADRAVDVFLEIAQELGLPTLDPRATLDEGGRDDLYFDHDWHLNPEGNAVFASFLHDELDRLGALPAASETRPMPEVVAASGGSDGAPFAVKLYVGLLVGLSVLYMATYPEEPKWQPPLKIGALLAVVFGLFIGFMKLQAALPQQVAGMFAPVVVIAILGFVAYKLGSRLGTISELIRAFTMRGHWYLMPLVIVLLTIGSLLVVAASSPLVAPFIYTLF